MQLAYDLAAARRNESQIKVQRQRLPQGLRVPCSRGLWELVGTGRFELPTCRLGGGRSIQLSYVPGLKRTLMNLL
jgi:hypothetical protein